MANVKDNTDLTRFELVEDGKLAWADYAIRDGGLVLLHVEAHPALRGKGTAGRLMEGILAIAKERGLSLRAICGYAAAWLARRPS